MVVKGVVLVMTLKRRIKILISELEKRGKSIQVSQIHFINIDGNGWERLGSEYEVYGRLMEEWEER